MTQEVKIICGVLAGIVLVVIVLVVVWMAATVSQLTRDKDRLDIAAQKLDERADSLADKVKALESQNSDAARDLGKLHSSINGLDTRVDEFALAAGRQLNGIKQVIVEQDMQLVARMDALEMVNSEYSSQIEELGRRLSPQKVAEPAPKPAKKPSGRIFVDVNNPNGPVGWEDVYTVQLRTVVADEQSFLIDWYKPYTAQGVSPNKPDIVKKTPKFKNASQLYFFLKLGDEADNRIVGVIDFAPTKEKYFPFDLYLDKDRDGDLAEDLISNIDADSYGHHVRGIKVPYKDGTTEEYSMQIYTVQDDDVEVWYGPEAGRYGVLEANQKKIGVLVLDASGNGLFNDVDDVILMDWDFDGTIDGSARADGEQGLYSVLELPVEKYRVKEIDPAGRHITLGRMH